DISLNEDMYFPTIFSADEMKMSEMIDTIRIKIDVSMDSKSSFSLLPPLWDAKTKTALIIFKDTDDNFIPVSATLIRSKNTHNGMIAVSKLQHEIFSQFDKMERSVKELKKEVITNMKTFAAQRKKLDFDEPSLIYETIAQKIETNMNAVTNEDTAFLKTALHELVVAYKDDLNADLQVENQKMAVINQRSAELDQASKNIRIRLKSGLRLLPNEKEFQMKRGVIAGELKALRARINKTKDRLPQMFDRKVTLIKRRFETYEKLLTQYTELTKLDNEKQKIIDIIAKLDNENIVLTISLLYGDKIIPGFLAEKE
ncbi:MAG: hypothetical protein LBL62_05570, partial [Planctomycetaceae bacterium]|nr:hypothetical protein [Planctomycetaceae bacterium]